MKLINCEIKINDILLDPYNPRFGEDSSYDTQKGVMNRIFKSKAAKELLASMKQNIKWVNRIVVREINTLTDEIKFNFNDEDAKYIVVEGNNRLACLKSGEITSHSTDTKIPVLLANKEERESSEEFETELKVTQGIANVMVVKQWSDISKAKHLYELCTSKLKYENKNLVSIIRETSFELGMSSSDVRKSILRYAFYREINNISDTIPDKYWGYLEGLDKNKELRAFFGLVEEKLEFEWTLDEETLVELYPDSDLKRELLIDIPAIIKSAEDDGFNTKQFRDTLVHIVDENKKNPEDVKDRLISLTKNDRTVNWTIVHENMKEDSGISQEELWKSKLISIQRDLTGTPLTAEWSVKLEGELIKIKEIITESLEMLEVKKKKLVK
ncbi:MULTISPECIES: hypothetical protein [unclassified Bacillus (in: firmicutes)]|uniref:hypothetical protein n=1 Tax=unclassified Bacillus (in: firmicutes) TaxID=185979 RepID=UPI001BECFC52|nr:MULTISPECIES: hypothetical protein [unclassified Bacillus (in: firmicutes)]MBT2616121.1 hypothetical protein [Bacillus sp. ISL-78]MBT2628429.1 hypothetical protein [Bacillus sp. ISL-101]